jgi:hypothetical protein
MGDWNPDPPLPGSGPLDNPNEDLDDWALSPVSCGNFVISPLRSPHFVNRRFSDPHIDFMEIPQSAALIGEPSNPAAAEESIRPFQSLRSVESAVDRLRQIVNHE